MRYINLRFTYLLTYNRRQTTDGRAIANSERERVFTFAKNVKNVFTSMVLTLLSRALTRSRARGRRTNEAVGSTHIVVRTTYSVGRRRSIILHLPLGDIVVIASSSPR